MMEQFVSMGYETIFSPYGGTHNEAPKRRSVASLALWNAYLWLRWPSLMRGYQRTLPLYNAFVIDMVLANGAEIPAPSEVSMFALANIELRARRGCDSAPPQGRRPEDLGPQQISESRFIHAVNKASFELNLRMAGGAKCRSKERSDVASK